MADTPRNKMVVRQWLMLKLIAASRYMTIKKLSYETGVCIKTIRRDVAALQEAGFPIYKTTSADDEQKGGYIRLDRNWLDLNGVKQPTQSTQEARV